MCGIAGYVNLKSVPADRAELEKMGGAMAHRGPDDKGVFVDKTAGLAHRRLAIIDPEGGVQPMLSHDERFAVSYNGEIYNYRELKKDFLSDYPFKTNSDTEALVAAFCRWGEECVNYLNGIFAFAVWDSRDEKLVLARDHLGVKPLYYALTPERFVFASEIKSILAIDHSLARLSHENLNRALACRFSPSPNTLFEKIKKLRPGHLIIFEKGAVNEKRYYGPRVKASARKSEKEAADITAEKIETAVKRQLVADVPVGVLLSGGVDSSLVAAIAAKHYGKSLTAFTVGFKEDSSVSEIKHAGRLAGHLGIGHAAEEVDHGDFLKLLGDVIRHLEEPAATSSAVPLYLLCAKVKETHKVVLSGQGADETWAGYGRHLAEKLGSMMRPLFASHSIKRAVGLLPRSEKLKRAFYALGEADDIKRFARIYSLFNPETRKELMRRSFPDDTGYIDYYAADLEGMDSLQKLLYLDVRLGLADDLLLYTDKVSMAHSVEVRVPFLDTELVDYVESLDTSMKLNRLRRKYLFKTVASRYLPDFVLSRRKIGFETPIDGWFKKELGGALLDLMCGGTSRGRDLFKPGALRGMIEAHRSGKEAYSKQLFMLLSFELWLREFNVSI